MSGEGPIQGETPPAAPVNKGVLRGRRGRDAERNFFTSPGAPVGWEVIHADINGALNIMRKVFRNFHWHADLTPKFLVFKFDQTANLSRLQLAFTISRLLASRVKYESRPVQLRKRPGYHGMQS